MKTKTKVITKYIIDLLDFLDGRGIIITDEELVKETLDNYAGDFDNLKRIIIK
jgi:hypothetical protein